MNVQGLRATPVGDSPRPLTLNERLNKALDRIETEGDRIQRALDRVNGTGLKEAQGGGTAVQPIRSLVSAVEALEHQAERFRSLSEGVDQVA